MTCLAESAHIQNLFQWHLVPVSIQARIGTVQCFCIASFFATSMANIIQLYDAMRVKVVASWFDWVEIQLWPLQNWKLVHELLRIYSESCVQCHEFGNVIYNDIQLTFGGIENFLSRIRLYDWLTQQLIISKIRTPY